MRAGTTDVLAEVLRLHGDRRADVRDRQHDSRIPFSSGPAAFFDAWCAGGPMHHLALGVAQQLSRVRKVADLLGLELAVVE